MKILKPQSTPEVKIKIKATIKISWPNIFKRLWHKYDNCLLFYHKLYAKKVNNCRLQYSYLVFNLHLLRGTLNYTEKKT